VFKDVLHCDAVVAVPRSWLVSLPIIVSPPVILESTKLKKNYYCTTTKAALKRDV